MAENNTHSQFFDAISKAKNILVALPKNPTADMVAGSLALRLFLQKLQKEVSVAAEGELPKQAGFLPKVFEIKPDLGQQKSFVISIKTDKNKLEELSYQTEEGGVKIYLKSLPKAFNQSDVSFENEAEPFDLVIVLGALGPEDLGGLFERDPDLFFQAPKINIDYKPGNEYFGAINIVDINATSVAEILTELLESYEQQILDEDIATCLLAGIISQTNSFQRVQTTPKVFLQASRLMALGGRQQEVIKHFYKTRTLEFLRLWGRSLARLKLLEDEKAMYTILMISDFEKAGTGVENLPGILRELMESIHGYKIICVAGEKEFRTFSLIISGHQEVSPEGFIKVLGSPIRQSTYGLVPFWVCEFEVKDTAVVVLEQQLAELIKNQTSN